MSAPWESLANEHILGIAPYEPGKPIEELERELGTHGRDQARLQRESARAVRARAEGARRRRSLTSTAIRTAAGTISARRSPVVTG